MDGHNAKLTKLFNSLESLFSYVFGSKKLEEFNSRVSNIYCSTSKTFNFFIIFTNSLNIKHMNSN